MFAKGLYLSIFTLMISAVAWSDEIVRARQPVKQRVDPKVLREALNLPEYQSAPPSSSQTLVDDILSLSQRLRKSGDIEGADLLQRFIKEHQQLAKQAIRASSTGDEIYNIHCRIVDVNVDELDPDSIAKKDHAGDKSGELLKELETLIASKKTQFEDFSLSTRSNQVAKCSSGGEFPVPIAGQEQVGYRDFGTQIEIVPTSLSAEKARIQLRCTISEKDHENTIVLQGVKVPGVTKKALHQTFELMSGQPGISSFPALQAGHRIFLITTATPRI